MKKTTILALAFALGAVAHADAPAYNFADANGPTDVFAATGELNASIYNDYTAYKEWNTTGSGKYFPMDVAPLLTGLPAGVTLPDPKGVDASKYQDQAAQFADVVNSRNQGGRPAFQPKDGTTATLASEQKATTIIQTVLSAVIDKPFAQLNLSADRLAAMAESIDMDHAYFHIPGSFALEALEKNHSAGAVIQPDKDYLLSVIDFRDYGCDALRSSLSTYFAKMPEKQRLANDSIYMISQLAMNVPADVAGVESYFGKHPDAVMSQTTLYADHLIRGGRTIFAFFAEGEKTRIILLSNIGLASKFMVGVKGALTRQYVLGGFGGVTGIALAAKDDLTALTNLLSGAEQDVKSKNSCSRGLALGLIKYSESLFNEFAKYIAQ